MIKYLSIIGTRPQYIKVLSNLDNHIIIDTGQHYDEVMSDIFLKQLDIKPKYFLGETKLGRMFDKCVLAIETEDPDWVIVYGDTRSTLAGALAAKFLNKNLAHVEAGMRSGDFSQPEELIRIIADRISDYKFCTDEYARANLINERLGLNSYVVGDVMWDSLSRILPIPKSDDYLSYDLLTIHRPTNADSKQNIINILEAVKEVGFKTIFCCHPRTRKNINKFKIKIPDNIKLIPPQGYKEMISLETNARKILTDSGGIQKEGVWFNKPVIVLRTTTEWMNFVDDGGVILAGTSRNKIIECIKNFNPKTCDRPDYGAKEKIKGILS